FSDRFARGRACRRRRKARGRRGVSYRNCNPRPSSQKRVDFKRSFESRRRFPMTEATLTPSKSTSTPAARPAEAGGQRMLVRQAAVLGAGVMGAQIAAHLANANVKPILFELAAEGKDKNANVKKAIDGLVKLSPSPLATASVVK